MQTDKIQDIKQRALKIDNLRALYKVENTPDVALSRNFLDDVFFICALEKIESYYLLLDMFINEKNMILKQERYNESPFPFYEIKSIFNNRNKIKIVFLETIHLEDYVKNISNYSVLVDKDKLAKKINLEVASNIKNELNSEEFYQEGVSFFINLIEVGVAVSKKNIVYANYLFDQTKAQMLELTRIYIGQKYDFNVGVGKFGENVKQYLDKEFYEAYLRIFNTYNDEKFWTSIFTLGGLYRKLGLEIARKMDFSYPKKEDVDSMSYLKFLYDNFGRRID
ncbi:MAG: aminoglycoside 6-adenylyltransferase [Tissierellia bacterium]|nr:aminoglycoside 6-adenylyltransferase [Tissierellia bacterium]